VCHGCATRHLGVVSKRSVSPREYPRHPSGRLPFPDVGANSPLHYPRYAAREGLA
jgi:hypothetical protein